MSSGRRLSGGKERRDLVSNGIDPFACFRKLLRGFRSRILNHTGNLSYPGADFCIKTWLRPSKVSGILGAQALRGGQCLDFRFLSVGFLGHFRRPASHLGSLNARLNDGPGGTGQIGPCQPCGTKQASRQSRVRAILQKICSQRWRVARRACLLEMRRADGISCTRSPYIFARWRGSGGTDPRNGFIRKIMHAVLCEWLRLWASLAPIPLSAR
jgi:hypothetical protein